MCLVVDFIRFKYCFSLLETVEVPVDENISASETSEVQTHVVHKPVHIRSSVGSVDSTEESNHLTIQTTPHRGDSGLAMSSESDCDSSYESNNASLQDSSESFQRSFPALTLVEDQTGNQDSNKQTTSLLENSSGTSPSGHVTSHGDHMVNHSAQTSLFCEGGIVYTKQVDFLSVVDSETQTQGVSVDNTQTEGTTSDISKQNSGVERTESSKTEMLPEYSSQLSVGTGYSINADI